MHQRQPIIDALEVLLQKHNEPYRTIAEAIQLGSPDGETLQWLEAAIHFDIKKSNRDFSIQAPEMSGRPAFADPAIKTRK